MGDNDPLGHVEFAVLDAVHRGSLRYRRAAGQVGRLRERPAGQMILHEALRSCERDGLVSSTVNGRGRLYQLTAAGRARIARRSPFQGGWPRSVTAKGYRGQGLGAMQQRSQ